MWMLQPTMAEGFSACGAESNEGMGLFKQLGISTPTHANNTFLSNQQQGLLSKQQQ